MVSIASTELGRPAAHSAAGGIDDGPWPATVALGDVVMGWIHRGSAAALAFAVLGALLGLISRRYLPTRSIFELMLHGG
jgi:hypothetical protein